MKKSIFFGERGITATRANHLANIAKECVKQLEDKINSVNFIDKEISLLAGGAKRVVTVGINNATLEDIPNTINAISEMKAFMAWTREAIKAKEALTSKLNHVTLDDYLKVTGITSLTMPSRPVFVSDEDIKSEMTVKEMNEYFTLEAIAAQIGNYIHPLKPYAIARDSAISKLNTPITTSGSGTDTIIYEHTLSVSAEDIDKTFFELQNKHREINARLNQIKHNIEQEKQKRNLKLENEFKESFAAWSSENALLNSELSLWKTAQLQEIQNLKIVIPEDLQATYDFLTNLKK